MLCIVNETSPAEFGRTQTQLNIDRNDSFSLICLKAQMEMDSSCTSAGLDWI